MNLWQKFVNFAFPAELPPLEDPETKRFLSLANNRDWELKCDKFDCSLISDLILPKFYDESPYVLTVYMFNDGKAFFDLLNLWKSKEVFSAKFLWGSRHREHSDCNLLIWDRVKVKSIEVDKLSTSERYHAVKMKVIFNLRVD